MIHLSKFKLTGNLFPSYKKKKKITYDKSQEGLFCLHIEA